jgi:hypothetical protein
MIEKQKQEKEEQELADKMAPLFEERFALELRRGEGVTLKKNEIIADRLAEIENDLCRLKTPPSANNTQTPQP